MLCITPAQVVPFRHHNFVNDRTIEINVVSFDRVYDYDANTTSNCRRTCVECGWGPAVTDGNLERGRKFSARISRNSDVLALETWGVWMGWDVLWVKAVHDKVSTFAMNLRKNSPYLSAYILKGALSDMHPVKLVALDGNLQPSPRSQPVSAAGSIRPSTRVRRGRLRAAGAYVSVEWLDVDSRRRDDKLNTSLPTTPLPCQRLSRGPRATKLRSQNFFSPKLPYSKCNVKLRPEGRAGFYCVSGLTPYAYKGGKSCKETCIAAKRDFRSHGLHFGAMTTFLSVLRASPNYEEQGRNRQERRKNPCDIELFSAFEAEKRGSYKGDNGTRYKCAIVAKRHALNWRALFSHCLYVGGSRNNEMRVKHSEDKAAPECKGGGNGRSPRKLAHQWHHDQDKGNWWKNVVFCVAHKLVLLLVKGRGGGAVRLLASHQGDRGSIPGRVTPGFLRVRILLVGWFSRGYPISPALAFRHCSILTSFHPLRLSRRHCQEPPKSLNSTQPLVACVHALVRNRLSVLEVFDARPSRASLRFGSHRFLVPSFRALTNLQRKHSPLFLDRKGMIIGFRAEEGSISETATFVNCSRASVVKVYRDWTNGTNGKYRRGNCGSPRAIEVRGERRLRWCMKANRQATVEQLAVRMYQRASGHVSIAKIQQILLRRGLRSRRKVDAPMLTQNVLDVSVSGEKRLRANTLHPLLDEHKEVGAVLWMGSSSTIIRLATHLEVSELGWKSMIKTFKVLLWSPNSPYHNPIEHLWNQLDRCVRRLSPQPHTNCRQHGSRYPWRRISTYLGTRSSTKNQQLCCHLRELIFACGNRAGRYRWSAGFLEHLPVPPPMHSGTAPYTHRFTLICSQDFDRKNCPNLFTPIYNHYDYTTFAKNASALSSRMYSVLCEIFYSSHAVCMQTISPNWEFDYIGSVVFVYFVQPQKDRFPVGRRGVVVRLLASHRNESGSIPDRGRSRILACGNRAGTMPLLGGFLEGLPFNPRHYIPTLLHTHLTSRSSTLNTPYCWSVKPFCWRVRLELSMPAPFASVYLIYSTAVTKLPFVNLVFG
ncbi:hypothetical protein PR048_015185 [Dryococelus australis]|uniref:Uncharacterized protein n=1 Tax=Dryococelus australis TaxID=614101 RepID=A0ABQ9HGH4_9NEOP|nr:hypothetical protein PR048_015185 [Dryococelus australis]